MLLTVRVSQVHVQYTYSSMPFSSFPLSPLNSTVTVIIIVRLLYWYWNTNYYWNSSLLHTHAWAGSICLWSEELSGQIRLTIRHTGTWGEVTFPVHWGSQHGVVGVSILRREGSLVMYSVGWVEEHCCLCHCQVVKIFRSMLFAHLKSSWTWGDGNLQYGEREWKLSL